MASISGISRRHALEERLLMHMKNIAAESEEVSMFTPTSVGFSGTLHQLRTPRGAMRVGGSFVYKAIVARIKREICRWACY